MGSENNQEAIKYAKKTQYQSISFKRTQADVQQNIKILTDFEESLVETMEYQQGSHWNMYHNYVTHLALQNYSNIMSIRK